ncbi:MAG: hypothetical protein H6R26_433 [Proteobacteria bacterium]|nr:hypothetical protein [Pseudomonadota bacterium]
MSLINQMLKDLESREQGLRAMDDLPRSVRAVEDEGRKSCLPLLLGGGLVAAAAVAVITALLSTHNAGEGGEGERPATDRMASGPLAPRPAPLAQPTLFVPRTPVAEIPQQTPPPVASSALPETGTGLPADAGNAAQGPARLPSPSPGAAPARSPEKAVPIPLRRRAAAAGNQADAVRYPRPEAAQTSTFAAESLYRRGANSFAAGRIGAAQEDLERALRLAPEHARARVLLARTHALAHDPGRALQLLEEGDELRGDGDAQKLRAQLLLKQGRVREAEQALALASGLGGGEDPELQGLLGAIRQHQGRHADAAESYRRAVQAQPAQSRWWLGLAISLEAGEQFQDALTAYAQVLALGGTSRDVEAYVAQRIEALRGSR